MSHLPRVFAWVRPPHRQARLTAPLVLIALACGDVTPPVADRPPASIRPSHGTLQVTELESLVSAADDARTRLVAPLTGAPGAAALSEGLARLSRALTDADAPAARQALHALDAALNGLTRVMPSAAPDLDAVRLVVVQTTHALDERAASAGPRTAPFPLASMSADMLTLTIREILS